MITNRIVNNSAAAVKLVQRLDFNFNPPEV